MGGGVERPAAGSPRSRPLRLHPRSRRWASGLRRARAAPSSQSGDGKGTTGLGFEVTPAATGRPAYHPAMLLKLYVYGYLNKVRSSRRLEREARRNVELM